MGLPVYLCKRICERCTLGSGVLARNCGKQHFRGRRLLLAAVQVTQIAFPCCSVPPPPPSPPPAAAAACPQLSAAVQPWLPAAQGLEAAQATNPPSTLSSWSKHVHHAVPPDNASKCGRGLNRHKSQTRVKLPGMKSSLLAGGWLTWFEWEAALPPLLVRMQNRMELLSCLKSIARAKEKEARPAAAGCARTVQSGKERPLQSCRARGCSFVPVRSVPGPARPSAAAAAPGCPVLRARFTCTLSSRTFGKIRASFHSCFYVQPTSGRKDPASSTLFSIQLWRLWSGCWS